jgi:hypothetical protein
MSATVLSYLYHPIPDRRTHIPHYDTMGRDTKGIGNAVKRGEVHRKNKREKAQEKLKRRMEFRKAEKQKGGIGEELKKVRTARCGGDRFSQEMSC